MTTAAQDSGREWGGPRPIYTSIALRELREGDRRLEGETYLTGGYAVRQQIQSSGIPFEPMRALAEISMPNRLKGVAVPLEHGIPYLTATQTFDIRPAPRKWLALGRTSNLEDRYVTPGTILVTRSGSVGDAIISYAPHEGVILSDDLLRVRANGESAHGYLYAFLRSRFGRTMLRSSKYGSIIKHLEPEHLEEIPVPLGDAAICQTLQDRVRRVFRLRDEAFALTRKAEELFTTGVGRMTFPTADDQGFVVSSAEIRRAGSRLDGSHFRPGARSALAVLEASGRPLVPLSALTDRIFGVARFKHVYQETGTPYLDSEDLFKVNPEITKFIPEVTKKNAAAYHVERGWLLMACSGQLYGLNGSVVLADRWHEGKIVSNHVIRIVPSRVRPDVRAGYLQMALGHPLFGRPLVLRLASGTSVPEIAPQDLADFPVIRLDPATEAVIADCVERASSLRMEADEVENAAVRLVEEYLEATVGLTPWESGEQGEQEALVAEQAA